MIWYWEGKDFMLQPVTLYRAYQEILIEALESWLRGENEN